MAHLDKAKELVEKFENEFLKKEFMISGLVIPKMSKACAIILCNEMIDSIHEYWVNLYLEKELGNIEDYIPLIFWSDVKKEILNF